MKKMNLLKMALATALCLGTPLAGLAGIVGSPHDFSGETWNIVPSDKNSTCGVCHQPHHADSTMVPLWIHTTTASTFTMYNTNNVKDANGNVSTRIKAVVATQPDGVSMACLSCHDGTVAVNSYAGGVKGGTSVTVTNGALIGTDLTHTHPISFTYDTTLATSDGFLNDPSSVNVISPDSGTFNHGSDLTIKGFLLNGGDRLNCNSCHDVHNQKGTPFDINNNPKLVKIVGTQGGKGSLLCRSCHIK
jgi:hypothetical protein